MAKFQQYNKQTGMWVGESISPSTDPDFGNTEVLLPTDSKTDGIIYVFDEKIDMWRRMTAEQFEAHLIKVMPPVVLEEDEFKAQMSMQMATLGKQVAQFIMATSRQTADLTKRVAELEKKQ